MKFWILALIVIGGLGIAIIIPPLAFIVLAFGLLIWYVIAYDQLSTECGM